MTVRAISTNTTVSMVALPSRAGIALGHCSSLACPSHFGRSEERMRLRKRTCFRIRGSTQRPFIIGTSPIRIRILKARFGIRTCPKSTRIGAALLRNSITIGTPTISDQVALSPKRDTVCGQTSGALRRRGAGRGGATAN